MAENSNLMMKGRDILSDLLKTGHMNHLTVAQNIFWGLPCVNFFVF